MKYTSILTISLFCTVFIGCKSTRDCATEVTESFDTYALRTEQRYLHAGTPQEARAIIQTLMDSSFVVKQVTKTSGPTGFDVINHARLALIASALTDWQTADHYIGRALLELPQLEDVPPNWKNIEDQDGLMELLRTIDGMPAFIKDDNR